MCEWNGYQVESLDADPTCAWCHAPSELIEIFYDASRTLGARELGRKDGAKGGRAPVQALSNKRRSQIARAAARARWKKL